MMFFPSFSPSTGGTKHSIYYIFLVALIWSMSLYGHLRGFLTHLPFIGEEEVLFVIPTIVLGLIIVTLPYTHKLVSIIDFLFILIVCAIYGLNYFIFPENEVMLDKYSSQFLAGTLPFFFLGVIFNLDEETERVIYWVSIANLFILTVYYLLYIQGVGYSGDTSIGSDMMGPSYSALPFVLILVRKMLSRFDWLSFFASVIGCILILSFGTRGPLVCLLTYSLVYLMLLKKYQFPLLSKTLILALGVVCVVFLNELFVLFSPIIEALGMSSRILDYFQSIMLYGDSGITDASIEGRLKMISSLVDNIGFLGHGIGSFSNITNFGFAYSHNIVVDFLIEYGWAGGSLLIIIIWYLYIKSWIVSKTEEGKSFILVLFCMSFMHLLFSHTYLIVPELFFALGYCVHVIREEKKGRLTV